MRELIQGLWVTYQRWVAESDNGKLFDAVSGVMILYFLIVAAVAVAHAL